MDEYADRLRAKLAPESVGQTLIRSGCFLSAYELIKSEVVDKVHDFYMIGFDSSGFTYDEAGYQHDVLSLDRKSKYRASCAWLVKSGALNVEQVATLEEIHTHRHEIAHELPKLLVDPDFEVRTDLLRQAIECIRALGVFWGSVEVDTDPQWDGKEVDYDGIKSGPFLLMEYLASLAGVELATAEGATDDEADGERPDH